MGKYTGFLAGLVAIGLTVGCDSGGSDGDGGVVAGDGGLDGATQDARVDGADAAGDAAVRPDAGEPDAGELDAGPPLDSAPRDAAPLDATPDAAVDPFGPPPVVFERQVLLEMTAGSSVGFQPDAYALLAEASDRLGGRLIAVAYHAGDGMETASSAVFAAQWAGLPSPAAVIDRDPGPSGEGYVRTVWGDVAAARLAAPSRCGLALDARRPGEVVVRGACSVDPGGPVHLVVMVVEDGVVGAGPGFDQENFSNATPGHPYEGQGDRIAGFAHPRVERARLTDTFWGEPAEVAGEGFTRRFALAPEVCGAGRCYVVAALTSGEEAPEARRVHGAQQVAVGELAGWPGLPPDAFGPPPAAFERRVLFEYPAVVSRNDTITMDLAVQELQRARGPRLIPVAYHDDDVLTVEAGRVWHRRYGPRPSSAVIDRRAEADDGIQRDDWDEVLQARDDLPPPCGIAIDARDPRAVRVRGACDETVGDGPVRLVALLVEDPVVGPGLEYAQANPFNGTPGHPAAGRGNPIIGYEHPVVFRAALTADIWGEEVPLVGGQLDRALDVPVALCTGGVCSVVVALTDNTGIEFRRSLYNAQQAPIGGVAGWAARE